MIQFELNEISKPDDEGMSKEKPIGFFISQDTTNQLVFRLPKFFKENNKPNLKDDKLIEEIFNYYYLFKKYEEENRTKATVKDDKDKYRELGNFNIINNESDIIFIEVYLSLMKDYKENNLLLFSRRTTNFKPKGNINWHKTMSHNLEIFSDNTVFYREYYYNNLNFNFNHPVTLLYSLAIFKIYTLFGLKPFLPYSYEDLKSIENSSGKIENILIQYEREMFGDREKRVFTLLKKFYNICEHNYKTKDGDKIKYAQKFDYIWENMLQVALYDQRKNKDEFRLPKGIYKSK